MAGQAKYPTDVAFDDVAYVRGLIRHIERMKTSTKADVRAAGVTIVSEAKQYAAVRTGFMKNNIVMEEGEDAKGFFVAILCRAPYWRFVEFGTRFMGAQPFMRPAFVKGLQFLRARLRRKGS